LLTFTQFGAEVDKTTQAQLNRGGKMVEVLKQEEYDPLPLAKEVMIIYSGINGFLDDLPGLLIKKFESEFYTFMEKNHPDIEQDIAKKRLLDDDLIPLLDKAIGEFKEYFLRKETK